MVPMKKILIALLMVINPWFLAEAQTTETVIDENWYQIELLVFKNNNAYDYLIDLPIAGEPRTTYQRHYSLVQGTALSPLQLPLIDAKRLSIHSSARALTISRKYSPIFTAGWKMYLPGEQEEVPIRIEGGEEFEGRHELEGFVTVKRNRYLHLEADLALISYEIAEKIDETNIMDTIMNPDSSINHLFQNQQPSLNTQSQSVSVEHSSLPTGTTNGYDSFTTDYDFSTQQVSPYVAKNHQHLKESRRMRSGELHYLDHPSFGVLIRINGTSAPVKEAPAPLQETPLEPQPDSDPTTQSNTAIPQSR